MQTISINFLVPQGWHELSDKQLRYVYQLLAYEFATDEIKTLCLLRWSGTKVIGRQDSGAYLLKKGKILFEVTPLTIAELLPHLEWLGSLPIVPVRLSKINRCHALPADFSEVPFETFIICDNLYQGYLQTQDDALLDQLGTTLYGKSMTFKPYERISIFYWFAALKDSLSRKYSLSANQRCHRRQPARFVRSIGRGRDERSDPCAHKRRCHQRERSPCP